MDIFCISDLHLSFSTPNKSMDLFGSHWVNHFDHIANDWKKRVQPDDLVCIAGDISWALKLEEAKKDLEWIDHLPGVKCMIKGNHDYWFSSKSKVRAALPPSIHIIQNDAFHYQNIAVGGTRLWDSPDFNFDALFSSTPIERKEDQEKIYSRELQRLELSLAKMDPKAAVKIALTHYPPISLDLQQNQATRLFEKFNVQKCLFGHLHGIDPKRELFGTSHGIEYQLTSCDYLDFTLLHVMTVE